MDDDVIDIIMEFIDEDYCSAEQVVECLRDRGYEIVKKEATDER